MRVVVHRAALKGLLGHTAEVAKASKRESLGWLIGFTANGTVYVADAEPCTRYRSQSAYGAEADPAEEAAIASAHPRAIGLVGLYHSHPFEGPGDHRFHSHVDDAMLRSRASRGGSYLSVVTDTKEATFFAWQNGEPREVRPEIVDELPVPDLLRRFSAEVAPKFSLELSDPSLTAIVAGVEAELLRRIDTAIERGEVRGGTVRLSGLSGGKTNALRVRRDGGLHAELELAVSPVVFLREGADVLAALRDEIQDDASFLLRQALQNKDLGDARHFEASLGTLKVQEHRRLPTKVYRPPKRGAVRRA